MEKETANDAGKVTTHAQQRRRKVSLSVLSPQTREVKAREVILTWVVLAGMPRAVRRARERPLPISEERAVVLPAFTISVPIFSMMRRPKRVPSAIKRAAERAAAV